MRADVLAIGAHPDDVELRVGGTIHKLAARGRSVVICDLTRGELGTRGTAETRAVEAAAAAKVLGVADRLNLGLPDGGVADTAAARAALIEVVREVRPTVILCHYWEDLHPDHAAAGTLMRACLYPGGFAKYPARGEPYRPHGVLFYMAHVPFVPAVIVDTTDHFEAKVAAIACYASQLHDPGSVERATRLARPSLLGDIEACDRSYGNLIERPYGEPFATFLPLPLDDPVAHFAPFPMVH
jgi:bacillithiol biosynthesis deacetylase BshB1